MPERSMKLPGCSLFTMCIAAKIPFSVYTRVTMDDDGNITGDGTQKEARLIYLFPVLPSITYNITF